MTVFMASRRLVDTLSPGGAEQLLLCRCFRTCTCTLYLYLVLILSINSSSPGSLPHQNRCCGCGRLLVSGYRKNRRKKDARFLNHLPA
jgi:hypothetical protein